MSSNTTFEFKAQTNPAMPPFSTPYTLIFMPTPFESQFGPVLAPMSYEVLRSARIKEHKIPLHQIAENCPEGKKNGMPASYSSAKLKPMPLPTLPTSGDSTEQFPITEPSKPATPVETADLIPSPESLNSKIKSKKKFKKVTDICASYCWFHLLPFHVRVLQTSPS
jgi:hypothetical protein